MGVESDPAIGAVAVTPHDSTMISAAKVRALWVGVAGNIAVLMADNTTATFVGIAAGTLLPISVKRVNSTNTTASSIVALY